MTFRTFALLACTLASAAVRSGAAESVPTGLSDRAVRLTWEKTPDGWRLDTAAVRTPRGDLALGTPSGEYTLLYSATAPSTAPVPMGWSGPGGVFPEPAYHYLTPKWADVRTPVALNTAGEARRFFPTSAERTAGRCVGVCAHGRHRRHPGRVVAGPGVSRRCTCDAHGDGEEGRLVFARDPDAHHGFSGGTRVGGRPRLLPGRGHPVRLRTRAGLWPGAARPSGTRARARGLDARVGVDGEERRDAWRDRRARHGRRSLAGGQ
jgi:hypothetical protein